MHVDNLFLPLNGPVTSLAWPFSWQLKGGETKVSPSELYKFRGSQRTFSVNIASEKWSWIMYYVCPVFMFTVCCCSVFPTQQDKGEEASGGLKCPASPAPLNHPPPPSRPTHRWHVIARHWLRQTRRRTSGVLPVTTRTSKTSRNIWLPVTVKQKTGALGTSNA